MKKTHFNLFLFIALLLASMNTHAQCTATLSTDPCTNITIDFPTSINACDGIPLSIDPLSYITIPSGFTITNFNWLPTTGVTPSSGTGPVPLTSILPATSTLPPPCSVINYPYTLNISGYGTNIIPDGDFSGASTLFCSDYTYASGSSMTGSAPDYTFTTDALGIMSNTNHFYDNTTGSGNMLLCNGTPNANVVWQYEIPVCPGSDYQFTFSLATLNISPLFPDIYVHLKDATGATTTYGPYNNGSVFDAWQQFALTWSNPVSSSCTTATAYISGNSTLATTTSLFLGFPIFAIDDISMNRLFAANGTLNIDVEYPAISGATTVCQGASTLLAGCSSSGTWTSLNPDIATVDALGNVTGVSGGDAVITFTDAHGCMASFTITVISSITILGPDHACAGETLTYISDGSVLGYWGATSPILYTGTSSANNIGSYNAPVAGTGSITFIDATTGCLSSLTVIINPLPAITAPSSVCSGNVFNCSTTSGAGYWNTTPPAYVVTGYGALTSCNFNSHAGGVATITVTNAATGCWSSVDVLINPTPDVLPRMHLCIGTPFTYINSVTGGTWTSTNSSVAAIDALTGAVTASGVGTTTISYLMPGTGCFRTQTMDVYNCDSSWGLGDNVICAGVTRQYTLITGIPTGGTWASSNTTVGTIDPTTGLFTALAPGTTVITYTVGSTVYSITVTVRESATACVNVTYDATTHDYNFNFTSSCSGSATIYYTVYTTVGTSLGTGMTTAGVISWSTIAATYGAAAFRVCVQGVSCNTYCFRTQWCCASVNPDLDPRFNDTPNEINGINKEIAISILPNPNSGSFSIIQSLEKDASLSVKITDAVGRVVYDKPTLFEEGISKMDASNFPSGLYLVEVTDTKGQRLVTKLIIEK